MAKKTDKPKTATAGKKKGGQWAKNTSDYEKKQKRKTSGGKEAPLNAEDKNMHPKSKRIEDHGQKPPKGYMRTGGRYFAKICNARPIQSLTTPAQRMLFEQAKVGFLGPDGNGGWVGSAANQGMYDGNTGEMNFRKTTAARKAIDGQKAYHVHPGGKPKSRYIMCIGQDGHMR